MASPFSPRVFSGMPARKRLIGITLIAVLAGFSSSHAAQPFNSGWYLGASAGGADYPHSPDIVLNSDARQGSYQFFVGYRLNRRFAVEGGYMDLGEAGRVLGWLPGIVGICVVSAISPCNGNRRETTHATAYKLAAIGTIPITDQLGVFGKLGIAEVKVTRVVSQYVSQNFGDTSTSPFFGVGVRYHLTPRLGIRAEWEKFNTIDSVNFAFRVDVQTYSLGVEFQF